MRAPGPRQRPEANILGDREFQNIVLQKRWIQENILHRYRQMQDEVSRIVALLEAAGDR